MQSFAVFAAVFALLGILRGTSHAALTATDKTTLLNLHNAYRRWVSPTVSNMEKMVWDDQLAQVAQSYAEWCKWAHNRGRSSSYPGYVGENLYVTTVSEAACTAAVTSWYNEEKDYDYDTNTCSAVCGHYTQVVWANSKTLGCGSQRCASVAGLPSYFNNALLLVCNYSPGGNYWGVKPYKRGPACSQCPSGTVCENSLCGKSFHHEKTKKKRGSYHGGSIDTTVNSIKFDSN